MVSCSRMFWNWATVGASKLDIEAHIHNREVTHLAAELSVKRVVQWNSVGRVLSGTSLSSAAR